MKGGGAGGLGTKLIVDLVVIGGIGGGLLGVTGGNGLGTVGLGTGVVLIVVLLGCKRRKTVKKHLTSLHTIFKLNLREEGMVEPRNLSSLLDLQVVVEADRCLVAEC